MHRFFNLLGFLDELAESMADLLSVFSNQTLLPFEIVIELLTVAHNPAARSKFDSALSSH